MADITEHQFPKASINSLTRSVLVTGGSGYVGSHCCKFLSKNGFIPVNIDRNLKNKPTAFGPSYDINLPQELERLDEIVNRYNITSCIHFAGSASVKESVIDPSEFYKNNVIGTIALLDKLVELKVKTFVYLPSSQLCSTCTTRYKPLNVACSCRAISYVPNTSFASVGILKFNIIIGSAISEL